MNKLYVKKKSYIKLPLLEAFLQRCSPRKMLCKHEADPQENKNAEGPSKQSLFATFLKSHQRTDAPKLRSTLSAHFPPGEHL